MIEKYDDDLFILSCDNCGERKAFDEFMDAVEFKRNKDNGWRTIKDKDNEWCELCPSCNEPEIIAKLKGVEI